MIVHSRIQFRPAERGEDSRVRPDWRKSPVDWTAWDTAMREAEAALAKLWEMSKTLPDVTPYEPHSVTRDMVQDHLNSAEFQLENAGVGISFYREA